MKKFFALLVTMTVIALGLTACAPTKAHAEIYCKPGYTYINTRYLKANDGFNTLYTVDYFKNSTDTRIGIRTTGQLGLKMYEKFYKNGERLKSTRDYEVTDCITYPWNKIPKTKSGINKGWRVIGVYASASRNGTKIASVKFAIRHKP